ncbi:MAG: hypothetical protein DRI57_12770 [Deltaproteobacteria bacterium]|nr:MAG: hypothetical protein DRI57_12770 [Deltaproteobacteria bacterium]
MVTSDSLILSLLSFSGFKFQEKLENFHHSQIPDQPGKRECKNGTLGAIFAFCQNMGILSICENSA